MVIIQILLGGITRLTDSGLSITEWQPILGTIPPLNEAQWTDAFTKYKQIAQYKYLHNYFSLEDFKQIYFWEWLHRVWGRLMGIVFLIPFVYFIWKKRINGAMLWPMLLLFILGGLQGALGWIMVKSGVGTELVYVSHIRLAIHFIAALMLLVYIIVFAFNVSVSANLRNDLPIVWRWSVGIIVLLTMQLVYGAFMAGTRAGKAAITWLDINGNFIPSSVLSEGSFLYDITHNLLTIQFIHRSLAYLLLLCIVVLTVLMSKQIKSSIIYKLRLLPLFLVALQTLLGILSVTNYLTAKMIAYSIIHQFGGMLLLVSMVIVIYFSRTPKKR